MVLLYTDYRIEKSDFTVQILEVCIAENVTRILLKFAALMSIK